VDPERFVRRAMRAHRFDRQGEELLAQQEGFSVVAAFLNEDAGRFVAEVEAVAL